MEDAIAARLGALRDVEGVLGSFLLDAEGRMLARDIPVLFDPTALAHAGLHLTRLRAALESAGDFESCVTRFGPHVLLLRAVGGDTLCVLCPRGTNLRAVAMSSTLIARRLQGAPSSARGASPAAFERPPGAPAQRWFRGRPL